MYEVEYKVELSEAEKTALAKTLLERGFLPSAPVTQHDAYVHAEKSPYGGYDLRRYRQEGEEYLYTEKVWEIAGNAPARKETEHAISKEEFDDALSRFPDAVHVRKERERFVLDGITVSIDNLMFGVGPRHFAEAEIMIADAEAAGAERVRMKRLLCDLLGKEDISEAPGMLSLALGRE